MNKMSRWNINPKNRIISLSKKNYFEKVLGFLGFPKYKVIDFYRYIMSRFDDEDLITFSVPLVKDGDEGSPTHPPRFVLSNDWIIMESDLKHLMNGPLLSEDKNKVLVAKNPYLMRIKEVIEVILYLIGALLSIYGLYELIIKFL